jgi:hypothetical protein
MNNLEPIPQTAPCWAGEWGHLPQEPCRYCRQIGGVYFCIDDGREGIGGLSSVRCDKCKRDWINDSPNA